jgi:hypothetical protein
MKKIITIVFVFTTCLLNAQAYKGKGDTKAQVGALIQSGANGISVSADFGLGENFSVGFVASYLLSVESDIIMYDVYNNPYATDNPKFQDRADIKARFNANIGNVIGLPKNMDVYPGLDLGLRNFGAHAGFRYFFTNGFGVFGETGFPIAKYDSNLNGFDHYNNQFTFTVGASFNLQ